MDACVKAIVAEISATGGSMRESAVKDKVK